MDQSPKVSKRDFLKKAGTTTASAVAATTIGAPYIAKAQNPIRWRPCRPMPAWRWPST